MIRRSTIVVVALFAIALLALLLILRNPDAIQTSTPTPMATAMAKLLPDWQNQEVIEAVLQRSIGGETVLVRNSDGSWMNTAAGIVAPGKVEQLLSEILATNILIEIPAELSLEDLNLSTPGQSITLKTAEGKQTTILVGGMTPTQSGYYVKVDNQAPVAVSKYAVEAVLTLFDEALPAPTPTPAS